MLAEQAQEHAQTQAQQATRAKRERSSDADAQHDADAESGITGLVSPTTRGGSAPQHQQPELEEEDSILDTDLAGDQGVVPMGAPASVADEDLADEGAARPRIRRREDPGLAASGTANAAAALGGSANAAAATSSGSGGSEQVCVDAGAAGASAAATSSVGGECTDAGEVPGSCIVYLYDNAPAVVLHEVVELIGIVSHAPQLAALGYDHEDPLLERELASLELGNAPDNTPGERAVGGASSGRLPPGERLAFESMRAAHPPTSKVMRLHGIIVRRKLPLVPPSGAPAASAVASSGAPHTSGTAAAPDTTTTTTTPATATTFVSTSPPASSPSAVGSLRERALGLLRWALGGDAVAAEYVLMQMLGRVTTRGDPAALGQLALNISRCPAVPDTAGATVSSATSCSGHSIPPLAADRLGRGPSPFAAVLQAAISNLVPLSVALPLTVEACNGISWAPERDHARERTTPSPLQLAPGTVMILDETVMAPGQLGPKGVASMQALMALARQQELMYDYETFKHPVPVDLPIIVLTEGRSLLRDSVPIRLPLNSTQPFPTIEAVLAAGAAAEGDASMTAADGTTAAASTTSSELGAVRAYLAAARTQDDYQLAEGMPTVLEQYFVSARRPDAGAAGADPGANDGAGGVGMSAEEFHVKLALARLLVLSHGENKLTRERWEQLLRLEHTREARLRVMN